MIVPGGPGAERLLGYHAALVEILYDPGGEAPRTIRPILPSVHAMRAQAAAFVQAIRGEAPPPCDATEALADLRVAREYLRLWKGV